MQLLIIIPRQPGGTGNQITASRFAAMLPSHGWDCSLIETEPDSPEVINAALKKIAPDAVLLLHAYRTGRPWLMATRPTPLPVTVLMTGTDLNHDQQIPERAVIIEQLLQQATAIIVQNRLQYQRLQQASPGGEKLKLLPPGIRLGEECYPLRDKLQLERSSPLFLHPAGIRPVKGNLELLLHCDQLLEQQPSIRLAFCGPPLDAAYTANFLAAIDARPWAHYLGEIPKNAIADSMRQADVILNHSESEGVSNALVEAAALGRPILARNIDGNRTVVQHGDNGLLYDNQQQFTPLALRLSTDLTFRQKLSKPNQSGYSADQEASRLAAILNQTRGAVTGGRHKAGNDHG